MNEEFVDFIERYEDENGQWRWRAKSQNGNILADSGQGYVNKEGVTSAVNEMFPDLEVRDVED